MADVSKKLMGQFADNLSDLMAASSDEVAAGAPVADATAEAPADGATDNAAEGDAPTIRVVDAPEVEAIDLLGAAGAPILKRLVPTLLAVAVVVVIILVLL